MAVSTIVRQNNELTGGTGTGLGISITYRKCGDVCSVYGTGTLTGALTAKETNIFTLPAGFRPSTNVVGTDYQNTNGSIRILSNGSIQSRVARAKGNALLFYVTYVMA